MADKGDLKKVLADLRNEKKQLVERLEQVRTATATTQLRITELAGTSAMIEVTKAFATFGMPEAAARAFVAARQAKGLTTLVGPEEITAWVERHGKAWRTDG